MVATIVQTLTHILPPSVSDMNRMQYHRVWKYHADTAQRGHDNSFVIHVQATTCIYVLVCNTMHCM